MDKERITTCGLCGKPIQSGCRCFMVEESGKPASKDKTGTLEDWL